MAILGVLVPNIDQAAHLGGLATGFASGLLLSRPWPVVPSRWMILRRMAMTVLLAAALLACVAGVTRWREMNFPPIIRFTDLADQLAAPVAELNALCDTIPRLEPLGNESSARRQFAAIIPGLTARAKANLARLHQIKTPDPQLRTIVDDLVQAQAALNRRLGAQDRFLQSEDPNDLFGPQGASRASAEVARAIHAFQSHQFEYMHTHGLIEDPPRIKP
jgi:rhomboid protease GluP